MLRFDRRLIHYFDWVLILLLILVCGMALANLFSSTWSGGPNASPVFYKQLYILLFGLGLIVFLISFDYRELETLGFVFYFIIILLLIYTAFFVQSVAGTQRWLNLGFFRLQPSEPAKLIMVVVLASYFSRQETGDGLRFRDIIKPGVLTLIPFVLILIQPDLGTALMLVIIYISMIVFFKLRWVTYGILVFWVQQGPLSFGNTC
jgi:rod shape determining protein RodA